MSSLPYLTLRNVSTFTASAINTTKLSMNSTTLSLGTSAGTTKTNFSNGSYAAGSWLTAKTDLTNPRKLATSSTGQYQLVTSGGTSDLWLSSDSGITWTQLTSATTGLPTLSGSAYWSAGSISASGQYILLSVYGGSLWMSQDYGRTFSLTNQPTPDIWLQLNGTTADTMGGAAATATGSPGYITFNRPGHSAQAINLANTAGGTATRYVRGAWTGATNFTVSFWMNPQIVNSNYQVAFSAYTGAIAVYIHNTTNLIMFQYPMGGTSNVETINGPTMIANTWYFISITFQVNNTCSFYVNNTLIGTVVNVGGFGIYTSSGNYGLGTYDHTTTQAFNGYIDDLKIYNSAIPYVPLPHLAPNIWMPFENSTADLGSNAITPTVTGSVSYVPGVVGLNAVNLANTAGGTATNYIRGAWSGATNFTVSFWMNPQSINSNYQIVFSAYTGGIAVYIHNTTSVIMFQYPTGGTTSRETINGPTMITNTWYFISITFQVNNTCSFYVNNTLIGTVVNVGGFGVFTSSGNYGLGTYDHSTLQAFNGYIDDFRIWNAAIPYHVLAPQNFRAVALSGTGQYALASAASGWVVGAADTGKTWSKQAVNVGTQGDVIQPNKSGLAQSTWEQAGVNWTVSASSQFAPSYPAFGAFNITIGPSNQWASLSTTYTTSGNTSGITTVVGGGVGTITGEWLQIQSSIPLVLLSYQMASGSDSTMYFPRSFYLVGSNDGSTWLPIQYAVGVAVPMASINTLIPGNILVNSSSVQTWGTSTITTTAYSTSIQSFSYFRMIFVSTFNSSANVVEIGELYLNFAKPSPSALALSYSGQYQLVATNSAAGSIMPNQSGLTANTWTQGGVQWSASASSQNSPSSYYPYQLFNNTIASYSGWSGTTGAYTSAGAYSPSGTSYSTTIQSIGATTGEWVQIQSSIPLVLQSYTYGCGTYWQVPKTYYIVGSMDGSTWYPLQYVVMTTNPLTVSITSCTSYVSLDTTGFFTNTTGSFTITGGTTGTGTSTIYSYSTQPWMFFRLILVSLYSSPGASTAEIGELYLNFSNSVSYSSNYGATWLNTARTVSNEIVALSPSGQVALSTNAVVPFARLTLNNTNVDAQGVLTPATGGGTVTYSSSIVKVGTHSAFFNNTAGGTTGINYLNYTVPTVLNMPSALTMGCWVYPTSIHGTYHSYVVSLCIPSQYGVHLRLTGGTRELCAYIGNQSYTVTTGQFIPLNTWSHVALTYTNYVISVYYNGVFVNSTTLTKNPAAQGDAAMTNFYVGCSIADHQAFAGYIDDVRIYTAALSAHEVAALYANPALTQSIGVSNSYLPITSYSKPTLPGATANVVDAKVSQTGQYMVAVLPTYTVSQTTPLARLTLDNTNTDAQGALTPATGAGTVTYSTSIKQVGTHSAFFNNTAGSTSPSVYLNYTVPTLLGTPSSLTMVGWIYLSALPGTNNSVPFSLSDITNGRLGSGIFILPNGTINLACCTTLNLSAADITTSTVLSINTWYHVGFTFNAGIYTLYLNGQALATQNYGGNLCIKVSGAAIPNVVLGTAYATWAAFAGYVDDVRLHSAALSPAEVYAMYAGYPTNNNVYYSTDSGATFTGLSIPATGGAPMAACSISYDGSYLTATNQAGTVYTLNRNATGFALALGNQAGQLNQGANAIALGNQAGQRNQAANSIVLNATGSAVTATNPGFYVSPIAQTSGLTMNLLGYGADQQVAQTGITVLPGNNIVYGGAFVGIGTTNPFFNLHVVGTNVNPNLPAYAGGGTIGAGSIRLQNSWQSDNRFGYEIAGIDNGVTGHDLVFRGRVSGSIDFSEHMRIKSSGNLGIGGVPYQKVYVKTTGTQQGTPQAWSTTDGLSIGMAATQTATSTALCMNLMDDGYPGNPVQYIGTITCLTPSLHWNNIHIYAARTYVYYFGAMAAYTSTGQWTNVSDEREKYDIQDLNTKSSLKRILSLKPKHYQRKFYEKNAPIPESIKQERHIGFLAQEVQSSNPHCISTWDNSQNIENKENDDGIRFGINYTDYIVHLCGAVQEQQKMIDLQITTISEQRQMIEDLTTKLTNITKWAQINGYTG